MKTNRLFRLFAILLAAAMMLVVTGCAVETGIVSGADTEQTGYLNPDVPEFMVGGDVSTLLALDNSGVKFYDFDGTERDALEIMRDAGVNTIRVRIWNDPYDENGNCYGAGICDVATGVEIGRRAAELGMAVAVDFHYSDYWADPGKQTAPKAWQGMTLEEKAQAIYDFTIDALGQFRDAGVYVSMVQMGNETTGFFCGEKNWDNICVLLSASSRAIHDFDPTIRRAVHFSDPHRHDYTDFAAKLEKGGVEYEIFGSSYYAFWHGTIENLQNQLRAVNEQFGKQVMVMETAWAFTYDEADATTNVVYEGREWLDVSKYPISVEGQKQALIDVLEGAAQLGDICQGVLYWEPAWVPVRDLTGLEGAEYDEAYAACQQAWLTYGAGWANQCAADYDLSVGDTYGGSQWECLALFDFGGNALDSLNAFNEADLG